MSPFFLGWQKSLETVGIGQFGLALATQLPQILGQSGFGGVVPVTFATLVFLTARRAAFNKNIWLM